MSVLNKSEYVITHIRGSHISSDVFTEDAVRLMRLAVSARADSCEALGNDKMAVQYRAVHNKLLTL